jgi:hypothetical protein
VPGFSLRGHFRYWPISACCKREIRCNKSSANGSKAEVQTEKLKIPAKATAYEQKAEVTDVAMHGAATDPG